MKIRNGFVSNSSSSSFIVVHDSKVFEFFMFDEKWQYINDKLKNWNKDKGTKLFITLSWPQSWAIQEPYELYLLDKDSIDFLLKYKLNESEFFIERVSSLFEIIYMEDTEREYGPTSLPIKWAKDNSDLILNLPDDFKIKPRLEVSYSSSLEEKDAFQKFKNKLVSIGVIGERFYHDV